MITATQGVQVTSACGVCGGVLVRDLGRFIDRGLLRWGAEGRCRGCSDAWCETGTGPAPWEIRQALLAEHGAVLLRAVAGDAGLVPVLRALRETYHLSPAEARLRAAELSGAGLVGTSVEMAYLAEGLRRRSVATTLVPVPA
ncbi:MULTISPECIES: hypothetical protein [unclassified Streptomyces]|uniref:hypothetical protein n=1 Tax=unclassified Streptomyces TaxID=2593676 RepID=UPI0031F955A5